MSHLRVDQGLDDASPAQTDVPSGRPRDTGDRYGVGRAVGAEDGPDRLCGGPYRPTVCMGMAPRKHLSSGAIRRHGHREQRQAILAHELAHVTRWDAAANLVQIIAQAAFFFHPLIWWTNRQIRREREKCCDEIVIAGLAADPKQYGQAIVNTLVAEYEASQPIPSLAVAGRLKNIEERIQTILIPNRRFYRRPSRAAVATVLLLAACAVPTVLVLTTRGTAAEQQPVSTSKLTAPTQPTSDAAGEGKDKPVSAAADTNTWTPGQTLDFRVINAKTKEPLPGVKLELQCHGPGINFQDIKIYTTNAEGRAEIRLPDRRPDAVRVYPSKAGFVPLRVYWGDDLPSPKLPKSVTVPMEPGTVWGGVIQNEKGEPIPGVKVNVHYGKARWSIRSRIGGKYR